MPLIVTPVGNAFAHLSYLAYCPETGEAAAIDEGFRILPSCSFIRGYMREHEETHELLAPGARLEEDAEQPAG